MFQKTEKFCLKKNALGAWWCLRHHFAQKVAERIDRCSVDRRRLGGRRLVSNVEGKNGLGLFIFFFF